MDDVRAVMDAVGSRRAALCGVSEGGGMAALFAATYPERTAALIMIGSYAKRIRDASYPWGPTEPQREEFLREIAEQWGGPVGLESRAPSMAGHPEFRRWWAAYLRTSASPAAAVALTRMCSEADIRSILPTIRVPTLVVHRTGDRCLVVEEGRYLADRIPGAKFAELPGVDHLPFVGDQDSILDEVEEFLTGVRHAPRAEPVLATVISASFELPRANTSRPPGCGSACGTTSTGNWSGREGRDFSHGAHSLLASFDGPARAIRCACTIAHHAARLGIVFRIGLHIGECEIRTGGIRGAAVDTAREIAQRAGEAEIVTSATVRDLVTGSGISFQAKGMLEGRGETAGIALLTVEADNTY